MKIIIISDVHIGNYPNYETYKYERLDWYVDFAQLIVEHAKEVGARVLFIAGDFMDQPVNSPEILRIAKKVVQIFSEYFADIYYILGQHDLKTKRYEMENIDRYSITNVLASSKMHYVDHQILKFGDGRRIAFMNFHPEPDLEWITDPVDVFVSHVTINTNGFGCEIDHSKFKLGIAGDIHYPCNEDNLYSVGIGVPRYLGDYKDGTYIVLETSDLSWERKLVDPNEEYFTRYLKTHNPDEEGPSEEKLKNGISPKVYKIYRPKDENILDAVTLKEFTDDRVRDINDIIALTIKENNFEDIHQKVLAMSPVEDSVDLDFQLQKLTITNIRSIPEQVVDFTNKEGVMQIAGDNGSGKSSIIWSLRYALSGEGNIWDEIREGQDFASVYLELLYQGKVFGIYRGTDGPALYIDGELQALGGKRATENGIYDALPFLWYLDSFFFMDDAVSILSSYSVDRRIELLSTYYRIDILQRYYQSATELQNELYQHMNEVWKVYAAAKDEYERKLADLEKLKDDLDKSPKEVLEANIEKLKKEYDEAVDAENKIKNSNKGEVEKKISELKHSTEVRKTTISNLETRISNTSQVLTANEGGSEYSEEEHEKDTKELEGKKEYYSSICDKYNSIQEIFSSSNRVECPECHTKFDIHLDKTVDLDELRKESDRLESEIESVKSEYKILKSRIENKVALNKKFVSYNNAITQLNGYKSQLELSKKTQEDELEELKKNQSKLELFDNPCRLSSVIFHDIQEITKKISKIEDYNKKKKELDDYENSGDLANKLNAYNELDKEYARYNLYVSAFATNGVIYKLVLQSILNRFNSDRFKYEVVPTTYRGTEYNDVIGYYKDYKMKNWRVYYKLSRGQRTLVDLDFIRNLVTTSGIIVFDEILKYLTNANQIEGLRIINSMNPRLKIVTNQNENSVYVDHCINLTYNGEYTEFEES